MEKKTVADWDQLARDYITSDESLRSISSRIGVSFKTVSRRASAGQWFKKRQEYKEALSRCVTDDIRDTETERIRGWQNKVSESCDLTLDAILKQSLKAETFPPTMMQAHIKSLETAMRIAREMSGYISPADQARLELSLKEFELKQREFERTQSEGQKEPIVVRIEGDAGRYGR